MVNPLNFSEKELSSTLAPKPGVSAWDNTLTPLISLFLSIATTISIGPLNPFGETFIIYPSFSEPFLAWNTSDIVESSFFSKAKSSNLFALGNISFKSSALNFAFWAITSFVNSFAKPKNTPAKEVIKQSIMPNFRFSFMIFSLP